MSMHLEKAWLNTNGKGKRRKSKSVRLQSAKDDHAKWLAKRGIAQPGTDRKRSGRKPEDVATPGYVYDARRPQTSDKVGNGFSQGVMANIHKEKPAVQREIMKKAARVESIYSKGPLQYVTDGTDVTMIGSKSRRG